MLAKLAIRIATFSLTTLALSAALFAQTTPRESLLVLSKQDHTVAIVDPTTLKVLARIPVGNDPHEVIASPDGNTAYVSNYGGGAYNTLTAVDVALQTRLNTIDLGPLRGPHGLDFVGGKVWFTAEAAKAIGSYDPGSSKVDWILGTGQNRTHMIYVSSDAKRIITTNVSSGTVSIIESSGTRLSNAAANAAPSGPPREDWNETVVKVGNGSEGFDVSPDRKEIKRIPVGHGAAGIQMQPDGSRAFVACTPDNYVVVIDLKSLQVTAHIDAGGGPDGMAWGGHR